jgi:hypothetical protein
MAKAREEEANRLEREAADLREAARLEDITLWTMKKTKTTGSKVYS